MGKMIDMVAWKSERHQRNISLQLLEAKRLREIAGVLLDRAEMIIVEASSEIDYEMMAAEKVKNLEALHNA